MDIKLKSEEIDVFQKNEIASNRTVSIALIISAAVFTFLWILMEAEVFTFEQGIPRLGLGTAIFLLIISSAVSKYFKYDKVWIKYLLMISMIISYAVVDSLYTYHVSILIAIPIVISCRYFSKRHTIAVTVIVFIVFCISAIMGANHGQLDLNFLQLAPGTVIDLGPYTWIEEAYEHWEYDHELMIYNVLIYSYFPKFLLGLIVAAFSITVASQGRKMVLEQESLTQKNASVTAELFLATKIQESMLPNLFPAFPARSEFDLYASMNPAKEVGGDFYDFFMVDEDHLALVMADVSGKGIPGAMFMMFSKNIIANNVMLGKNPAKALADANAAICKNNAEEMFVTVWLGVFEISTGKLTCANAGHEYPFFKQNGEFALYKDKHGFSVGWFEDSEYTEYEIKLSPGDRIFVYTDGVPEATNGSGEMYGTDRALAVLNRDKDASCEKLLKDIWEDVGAFVGEAEQFDDLTMLALEYRG